MEWILEVLEKASKFPIYWQIKSNKALHLVVKYHRTIEIGWVSLVEVEEVTADQLLVHAQRLLKDQLLQAHKMQKFVRSRRS